VLESGSWSVISGTGGVFSDAHSPTSQFTGNFGSAYTLRWTISNGTVCGPSTDDVVVTFSEYPSTADAGPDRNGGSICGLNAVNLDAQAPISGTGSWSIVSGEDGTLDDAHSPTSEFRGTSGNVYSLRWTVSTACGSSSNDIIVALWEQPTMPVISGGGTVCGQTSVTLASNEITSGGIHWEMDIDNQPGGSLTVNQSGAIITGLMGNSYGVMLRVANGPCKLEDHVVVVFTPNPTVAIAGPDHTNLSACGAITASLSGNSPSVLERGNWSVVSGPDAGGFSDLSNPASTFTGTSGGTYTLRWTITRDACTSSDDVVIAFTDQTLCNSLNYVRIVAVQKGNIKTDDDFAAMQTQDNITTITYFDGLGRTAQSVIKQNSPDSRDVVQPVVYDEFGREKTRYLPYTSPETTGAFKQNALSEQANFYLQGGTLPYDSNPYTTAVFELSSLNRPVKQGAPGTSWQPNPDAANFNDNTIKKKYSTNGDQDVLLFTYDASSGLATLNGNAALQHYAAGQLTANSTFDEHNNEVIEYTDKLGHVVCKKVQYATVSNVKQYVSTYYIYDDLDNLVVVLPPEAIRNALASFVKN
jgi:hypothetical protein